MALGRKRNRGACINLLTARKFVECAVVVALLQSSGAIMVALLLFAALTCLAIAAIARLAAPYSSLRLPAPAGHLIVGHLPLLMNSAVHRVLTRIADDLGGLFKIRIVHLPVVVVSDPQLVGGLLRGSSSLPKAAMAYDPSLEGGSPHGHRGLFNMLTTSDEWSCVRKAVVPAFKMSSIKQSHLPVVLNIADKLVKILTDSGEDTVLDLNPLLLRATLDILGRSALDVDFRCLDSSTNSTVMDAINDVLEDLSRQVTDPFLGPMRKLLPFLPDARRMAAAHQRSYAFFRGLIAELRGRGEPAPDNSNLWACIMRIQDPRTEQLMDTERLMPHLTALVEGGYHTSAHAVTWLLYDIARADGVQLRLREELRSAGLLSQRGAPPARPLTWQDLTGLQYFELVLQESMRLHCLAGTTATFRQADRDLLLRGVHVAAGTLVWVPLYVMANSRHNFVEPQRFWPERWDPQLAGQDWQTGSAGWPETAQPWGHVGADSSLLPFSVGPRDCVGQNMANVTVRALALTLLSHLWFEVAPDMGSHEEVEEGQRMALVVTSARGILLRSRPHSVKGAAQG